MANGQSRISQPSFLQGVKTISKYWSLHAQPNAFLHSFIPHSFIDLFCKHIFIVQFLFQYQLNTLQGRTGERSHLYCAFVGIRSTRLLPHSHCCNKVYIASNYSNHSPYTYTRGGGWGAVGKTNRWKWALLKNLGQSSLVSKVCWYMLHDSSTPHPWKGCAQVSPILRCLH